jgi:lipopolysaccharide/colanic/teichoic acid biosynthesis glycosyltransferase
MVELDHRYVTTWSLFEDLRLLLRTVPVVLRGTADSP